MLLWNFLRCSNFRAYASPNATPDESAHASSYFVPYKFDASKHESNGDDITKRCAYETGSDKVSHDVSYSKTGKFSLI